MREKTATAKIFKLVPRKSAIDTPKETCDRELRREVRSIGMLSSELNVAILMRDSDISGLDAFLNFARKFKPKLMLDLRLAPRLDFVAGSRMRTFKLFEELNVHYVDVWGRMGVDSVGDGGALMQELIVKLAQDVLPKDGSLGHVIFVFDDEKILNQCRSAIFSLAERNRILQKNINVSEYRDGLLAM